MAKTGIRLKTSGTLRRQVINASGQLVVSGVTFGQGFSVKLDGAGSTALIAASSAVGVANAWSAGLWYKPDALAFTQDNTLYSVGTGGVNQFLMRLRGDLANEILMQLSDSAGTSFKVYALIAPLTVNTWHFLVMTWDGTDLVLYIDGTERNPLFRSPDDAGTQTDTVRPLSLGINPTGGGAPTSGKFYAFGLWSSVLTSGEQLALYNTGDGAAQNFDQVASASLQHWYRPGFAPLVANIGRDYGVAVSGAMPLVVSGTASIVADAPGFVDPNPIKCAIFRRKLQQVVGGVGEVHQVTALAFVAAGTDVKRRDQLTVGSDTFVVLEVVPAVDDFGVEDHIGLQLGDK